MPDMQTAIAKAGLPVKSQRQRCWQIIKDNGPQTVKAIAARMNITQKQAGNTISAMVQNGMLKSEKSGPQTWYTAVGTTYEESLARSGRKRPALIAIQAKPPAGIAGILTGLPPALKNMTIAQLHQSYLVLQKLFGSDA